MRKIFIIFVILIFNFLCYGCSKEHKSTLTIKNWPYKGSEKIVVYIYENLVDTIKSPDINSDELKKLRSEDSRKEALEYLAEAMINSMQNNSNTKRVAKCVSLSLSSPFKLISDDGKNDWVGNGTYMVKIIGADNSISNMEINDVVFTNGSATIDYHNMKIRYRTQKEQEKWEKINSEIEKKLEDKIRKLQEE